VTIFLGKKFSNSLKIGQHCFHHFKIKFQFREICGYKKRYDNTFFFTPLFCWCFLILDPGSEIRDPRSRIRDGSKSGSGIQDKNAGSATLLIFTEFRPIPYFGYKGVLCDDCQTFSAWFSIPRLEG
jgi:hypothetical protein